MPILTMFAAFLGEDKPFPVGNRFEKSSLGGATTCAPTREKVIKIRENGCKVFVRTTSAI